MFEEESEEGGGGGCFLCKTGLNEVVLCNLGVVMHGACFDAAKA